MRAIQTCLPNPRHTETMRIFVQAAPEVAWQAARHHNLTKVPWIHFLFELRTITDLFHDHQPEQSTTEQSIIDQIKENGKGFLVLSEIPGEEIVIGAIGQFWHLTIPFTNTTPEAFIRFNEPGWGKLAWSIRVEPYLNGSTICLELRTTATDEDSWHKLTRYYHVIGVFSNLIRHTVLNQLEKQLGKLALPDDAVKALPGDDILPESKYADTDHINIEAPPSIVWHYLMQLGCDRGGWYSIDLFDHGGVPSTAHWVREWQDRAVGDQLAATPKQDSYFEVQAIEHEKFMILTAAAEQKGGPFKVSWAFVLEPIGEDATHLITRARLQCSPEWKEWFMGNIYYPPVHGLMEAVQLKTIRRYAERDAQMRTVGQRVPATSTPDHIY